MTQLSDQFVQDWYVQLNRPGGKKENMSNKLRTYRLFKKVFQLEYYLTCVTSANYRKALTKQRVSCHHLAGRYHKPSSLPVEQRLCSACIYDLIDEVHLLCTCTHNAHIRRKFFNLVVRVYPYFESLSRIEKFIVLMQTHDPYVINYLAA